MFVFVGWTHADSPELLVLSSPETSSNVPGTLPAKFSQSLSVNLQFRVKLLKVHF